MSNDVKKLQERLLQMLTVLDKFCEENDIEFFLAGGSTLGAKRHKGFIPWDDDVDIAMMRTDFEKLERCMRQKKNILGEFVFSPVEEHLVPDAPIAYLYDNIGEKYGYDNVAKIDIHPIDGVPDSRLMRKVQNFFTKVYYLSIYRLPAKNKGKFARKATAFILKITPDILFRAYMRISKRIITSWSDKDSKCICSLFGVAGYEREIMPRKYVMPLKKAEFEGVRFGVPHNMDWYLKRLYGDYMKLPPESERAPRHKIHELYR